MNSYQRKITLRHLLRSFFALCFTFGYLINSFLFVFALPENTVSRNELTFPVFGNIGHRLQVFGGNYTNYPNAISFGVRK